MSGRPIHSKYKHFQDSFVSKLLTFLHLFRVLPARIDDHPSKGSKLCTVAPLSCLSIHSIAQRIFEHVTTLLLVREVFPFR